MDCACVYSETCVRRLVVKTEEGVVMVGGGGL